MQKFPTDTKQSLNFLMQKWFIEYAYKIIILYNKVSNESLVNSNTKFES